MKSISRNKKTIKETVCGFAIFILGLVSISGCFSPKKIQSVSDNTISIPTIVSTTDTIYILIEEIGFRSPVPLLVNDTLNINMGNEGKDYQMILKAEKDSLLLEYKGKSTEQAIILKDDIELLININYGGAEATFSREYRLAFEGKVTIEFPEVYELVNIVFAISNLDSLYPGRIDWNSNYSKEVKDHFGKYQDHPLIRLVNNEIEDNYSFYRNLRANSYAYTFDGEDIISRGVYTRISEAPDLFIEFISQLQDFAFKSDFKKFYKSNLGYFNNLIKNYESKIPVMQMWQWLETKFSNKVNSYKLILSPLVGSHHFTMNFEDNGFIENLMFINVVDMKEFSELNVGNISRQIFTEIDHNYVNPTTKFYSKQILNSISDYKPWNTSDSYSSTIMTFDEYMTWGTFTLFAQEYFNPTAFKQINLNTELIMVKSRGFVKFDSFNQELLKMYLDESNHKSFSNLYPGIIAWMKNQDD